MNHYGMLPQRTVPVAGSTWQNPYFKAVLAAMGLEVATPPSVFARGG